MTAHPTAPPRPTPARTTPRARDLTTVALLVGSALFLVLPYGLLWAITAWVMGAVLLWTSPSWAAGDKALGTLVWPGGLIGPLFLLTRAGQVCTQVAGGDPVCTGFAFSPWVGIPLGVLLFAAPFVVATRLLRRADA